MPIYRLRPIADELANPRWEGSTHRGPCIVHAPSENRARDYATDKFKKGSGKGQGEVVTSPWRDSELVDCAAIASSMPYTEGMVEIPAERSST